MFFGKITFELDDEVIYSTNLVASKDIEKLTLFTMTNFVVSNWMNLLRVF